MIPRTALPILLLAPACATLSPSASNKDAGADTDTSSTSDDTGGDTFAMDDFADSDADDIPGPDDNCPAVANPDQADADLDEIGDACDDDRDGDLVPDFDLDRGLTGPDRWPDDPQWPGVGDRDAIYAHTRDTLYRFFVPDESISQVGAFSLQTPGPGGGWIVEADDVSDLAIDAYGVLYATTFTALYVCNPSAVGSPPSVVCRQLAELPTSNGASPFNGLTLLPPGAVGPEPMLIAMRDRYWYEVDATVDPPVVQALGTYGPADGFGVNTISSGDAFSIRGVGTFATVNRNGSSFDARIVEVDPSNGRIQREISDLPGSSSKPWGLAGWSDGRIYVFDASGKVYRFDPGASNPTLEALTGPGVNRAWWGAAVRTVVPTTP